MREDARSAADAFRARSAERRRGNPSVHSVRSPLSAELVRGCARDGLVIVTWASAAFLDFLANWVHHLVLQEADNFLIGAARRSLMWQKLYHAVCMHMPLYCDSLKQMFCGCRRLGCTGIGVL